MLEDIIEELYNVRVSIVEAWTSGSFTAETADGTAQLNAQWLGKVQMLDEVIDMLEDKNPDED